MRKIFFIALVIAGAFLFAPSARAQFTTVTATVKDSNGIPYANGTMSAILVPGSTGGYTLSGQPYSGRIGPITLDSTGHFAANFGDVTLIMPGSPQWLITVNSNQGGIPGPLGTGAQTFTFTSTGTTISGSSPVDISTSLNALAPKLTNITVGSGSVTSVAASSPIVATPSPITTTGTISCPTCVAETGSPAANDLAGFASGTTIGPVGNAPWQFDQDSTSDIDCLGSNGCAIEMTGSGTSGIFLAISPLALLIENTSAATGSVFSVTASPPNALIGGPGPGGASGTLSTANGAAAAQTNWGSAATTTNTILGFATAPTTTDLIECVVSGSTCTFTDTGIPITSSKIPIANVGTAGLSGTAPITISAAGAIACSTCNTSSATVTSVSFTGGLISVATPTTTPAFTVAGTSGGIPYFNSATTWATSAALASGGVVLGGGAGSAPTTSTQLTFAASTLTVGLAGTSSGILNLAGSTSGGATFTAPATAGTRTNPVISSNYFQIGVAGTTSGELLLAGSTSGTATILAPATAGTSTNPIAISNVITVPSGAVGTPSIAFASATTTGIYNRTGTVFDISSGGVISQDFNATATGSMDIQSAACVGYSTNLGVTAPDTNVCRNAAGVIEASTSGSSPNASGTYLAATVRANTSFSANGTAGASAGPFTAVTSITSTEGLVTSLSGTSDARLKTDILPFTRGLADVMKLHPAIYGWNEKGQQITNFKADVRQAGFIAQDVRDAIPEAVGTEPHDGIEYLTFSDRPVLAALVNAVKEQQAEIETLKDQIETMNPAK